MRLNRFELRGLNIRRTHCLAQLDPRQFQIALGRNQLLFASGPIHEGRHPVRFHRKAGLDMLLNRVQQGLGSLLFMLGDIDLPLRIEHRLVRRHNSHHNLLVYRLGR